jgi:hypothetical protein
VPLLLSPPGDFTDDELNLTELKYLKLQTF